MHIDLNCDLGEGGQFDDKIMSYISSCNIACGGHYGTYNSIRKTIQLAKDNTVKIGAHPSYPDQVNFGRKSMKMSANAFIDTMQNQLNQFFRIAKELDVEVNHIKAHGALYNDLVNDETLSKLYLSSIESFCNTVYVPYRSVIANLALEQGFKVIYEAFADRQYNADLSLVSRINPNAVIHNADEVFNHVKLMLDSSKVKTIIGKLVPIKVDTCCVHGDNPEALALVKTLYQLLMSKGYTIG